MNKNTNEDASVYDRLKSANLDARDVIARLGLEITRALGAEAHLAPLCHESTSGESLQVNLATGFWNCKACQGSGYYGDLIQFVEYVLSNGAAPSHGKTQSGSASHQAAIEWLCREYGIPYHSGDRFIDPALDAVHLFAMNARENLLQRPEVLEWIAAKWGFDLDTVERYGLGFMPSPMPPALLAETKRPESKGAFAASGLGWFDPAGDFRTRFAGRITFPYLEHGRAVYLIGRSTPWTPKTDEGFEPPKYHKLAVYSDTRTYLSKSISNDHLYLEGAMAGAREVGLLEGIADALAISNLGVSVVSPVTIALNAVDLERFVRKCREQGIARVWILFDNELSGSGNQAAIEQAKKLVEAGLSVTIVTLPLPPAQAAARGEVLKALGEEQFAKFESLKPGERKKLLEELIPDESSREWVSSQIADSKIDAAEWSAIEGAGAAGKFDKIRKAGRDVVELAIERDAKSLDDEDSPQARLECFENSLLLAAHVDERLMRESYASLIAKLAGRGVTKVVVVSKVSSLRKALVAPKRREEAEDLAREDFGSAPDLLLPPPSTSHVQPEAPAAPPPGAAASADGAPAAPPAPAAVEAPKDEHEQLSGTRARVIANVERKGSEELIGEFVSQVIVDSMGFTPFLTTDELYLVRGNERIAVGLYRKSSEFASLLYRASGLTPAKNSHRSYIEAAIYFLKRASRKALDVAWSYVDDSGDVYFPTGDFDGSLLHITAGKVERRRMGEAKIPAVAGENFRPFRYVAEDGGVERALDLFRWTSLSPGDRMALVYWIVCLPILRRIGTVPILRIEGGSSSGKTRAVDATSILVNGGKRASVPTAAALISRLAVEMLTIDDNREANDVTASFLGTLLQAPNLGAREKRRQNSDTGTIVEVDHPERGKYLTVGNPIKLSDSPADVDRSPLLGEHTDEILSEIGLSADDIAASKSAGAV